MKKIVKYNILMALVILTFIVSLGLFNLIVDPYNFFYSPKIEGFNALKTHALKIRLSKPVHIFHKKPSVLILGNSSGGRGFRCSALPKAEKSSCYNGSVPSMTMYESLRTFEHTVATGKLEKVYLLLSYGAFTGSKKYAKGIMDDDFLKLNKDNYFSFYKRLLNKYLYSLFSYDGFSDSRYTIFFQNKNSGWFSIGVWNLHDDGSWSIIPFNKDYAWQHKQKRGTWALVINTLTNKFKGLGSDPQRTERHIDKNSAYLSRWLTLAQKNNIDVQIMIPPSHSDYLRIIDEQGLWESYENWKRMVVSINELIAKKEGDTAYSIWDFSGIHQYSREESWENIKNNETMKWYADAIHFDVMLGDEMLAVANQNIENGSWFNKINSQNIDYQIKRRYKEKENYFIDNPRDLSGLNERKQ